jgi:ribosome recycling factor
MGLYKQALSDVQKSNKAGEATPESLEAEKRLRDILSGKRPNGAIATANGSQVQKTAARRPQPVVFTAKVELDGEMRSLALTGSATYAELLHNIHEKFPSSGPVVLKYLDREGDLVTITDRLDLGRALQQLVDQAQRGGSQGSHGGPRLPDYIPPLRVQAVRVKSEDEVPKPPQDEQTAFNQLQMARKFIQEHANRTQQQQQQRELQQQQQQQQQPAQQFEVDPWMAEFAGLFRDHTNIDQDRPLEFQNLGWDKSDAAMKETLASEKAEELLEQAADKFLDMACSGFVQQGNVYQHLGARLCEQAGEKGSLDELRSKISAQYERAEKAFQQALDHKATFYDACVAMGQLEFDRAKLAADYVYKQPTLPPVAEGQSERTPEEAQRMLQDLNTKAQHEALQKNVTAEGVKKAETHIQKAVDWYKKAVEALPEEERNKPLPQQGQAQEGQEDEINFYVQTLIIWGNMLYEHSQLLAAAKLPGVKELAKQAEQKFKDAGCAAGDIRNALMNHIAKEEIEIPPEPEKPAGKDDAPAKDDTTASKAKEDAPASKAKEGEAVKGLPALGKPKGKASDDKQTKA